MLDGGEDHPSFDVVAPSLPNFGFSGAVLQKGFDTQKMAVLLDKLMVDVLDYPEYVTQGGDVGYSVTRFMGLGYPERCRASHYNMVMPKGPPDDAAAAEAARAPPVPEDPERDRRVAARSKWFRDEGMGYFAIQATRPQTVGYGLTDSPVGLLAWVYEKLHDWTDGYPFTDYDVCKWVSIYWFSTAGPRGSLQVYWETRHSTHPLLGLDRGIGSAYVGNGVKIGVSNFPAELVGAPPSWNASLGKLVFNRVHSRGGHFAAFEVPDLLVGDLRDMFGKGGGAYGAVAGRSGYAD